MQSCYFSYTEVEHKKYISMQLVLLLNVFLTWE